MQKFAIAFIAAAVVASAGAALAQDYRIPYGDLDLATTAGAGTFDARVQEAARRACSTGATIADGQCRLRFRAEALRQLPGSARDEYARARGGRVLAMVPVIYG